MLGTGWEMNKETLFWAEEQYVQSMRHKTHNICRGPVSNSGYLEHRKELEVTLESEYRTNNEVSLHCALGFGFYPTGYKKPLKAFR